MHIIITGSLVYGFTFIGPFETESDAEKYAADHLDDRHFEIDELFTPNENA